MRKEVKKQDEKAPLTVVNLEGGNLPDLSNADVVAIDLSSNYWTPEFEGEQKRIFFIELKKQLFPDINTGEMKEFLCVVFLEQDKDGTLTQFSNGSKVLVGIFENNNIKKGQPMLLTYKGRKPNKKNKNLSSDRWSVKPLNFSV